MRTHSFSIAASHPARRDSLHPQSAPPTSSKASTPAAAASPPMSTASSSSSSPPTEPPSSSRSGTTKIPRPGMPTGSRRRKRSPSPTTPRRAHPRPRSAHLQHQARRLVAASWDAPTLGILGPLNSRPSAAKTLRSPASQLPEPQHPRPSPRLRHLGLQPLKIDK